MNPDIWNKGRSAPWHWFCHLQQPWTLGRGGQSHGGEDGPSLVEQVIETASALSAVATVLFSLARVSLHLETGLPWGQPMSRGGCKLNFPYLGLKPDGDWTPTSL